MTKIKKVIFFSFISIFLSIWVSSCANYKLEKSLDSESQEFLSKTRYTITPEERKTFLQLPASERPKFIEDFWKRRDPYPETPINEFKEEYFRRIEEANRLFSEGGSPGWLSDRGRIWITLGPPDNRETYPRGQSLYGKPVEIWYYGFYPIVFIDQFWNGNYQLDPASAEQIALITQTQVNWNQPGGRIFQGSRAMDFEVNLKKTEEGKALLSISLPFNQIWFKAQNDRFETTIDLTVEIEDSAKQKVWSFHQAYPLSLTLEELKENFDKSYVVEQQVEIKGQSPFTLRVIVENKLENKKSEKRLKFEF
ncbi:MAG: GWxTD domain-containing protein [Candidatus Aminicenantes bacterium]|nr:GWxTD domain-containing protein [Candidatus Aminicenantes bacterium]